MSLFDAVLGHVAGALRRASEAVDRLRIAERVAEREKAMPPYEEGYEEPEAYGVDWDRSQEALGMTVPLEPPVVVQATPAPVPLEGSVAARMARLRGSR